MPSPLPEIVAAWFRESGRAVEDCTLIEQLVNDMVRRGDFLPLELMAAKAGFGLCPSGPAFCHVAASQRRGPRAAA